jgi:hypothetical protein
MALLWIDGFDTYGTSVGGSPSPVGILQRSYNTVGWEDENRVRAGRLGGYATSPYQGYALGTTLATTNDTLTAGFAFRYSWASVADSVFFAFLDGSTVGVNLVVTTSGEIAIYCGATLLATTSGLGLLTDAWYYCELKVKCNSSTGTYEVRLGEAIILSNTGKNTKAGTHDYHNGFSLKTSYARAIYDDLYVLDSSGSVNTTFLGNMRVVTIQPDAAGDSTQFTPDSGDNYARVNEAVCDDDTSYVEDTVSGNSDLYNYAALSGITGGIKGIAVVADCRETDATNFSIVLPCKSGATTSDGSALAIGTTSYTAKRRIIETDPDTSAAWTASAINSAQFGVKVN